MSDERQSQLERARNHVLLEYTNDPQRAIAHALIALTEEIQAIRGVLMSINNAMPYPPSKRQECDDIDCTRTEPHGKH